MIRLLLIPICKNWAKIVNNSDLSRSLQNIETNWNHIRVEFILENKSKERSNHSNAWEKLIRSHRNKKNIPN